jgi:hypothetical protein
MLIIAIAGGEFSSFILALSSRTSEGSGASSKGVRRVPKRSRQALSPARFSRFCHEFWIVLLRVEPGLVSWIPRAVFRQIKGNNAFVFSGSTFAADKRRQHSTPEW